MGQIVAGVHVGVSRKERLGLLVHRLLDRWLSPLGVRVMRRTKGRLAARFKVDAFVLTTVGRRSRRARSVVLQFFPDGDSFMVAAANDGAAVQPAWYLNLKASPNARVEVYGRRLDVLAEELVAAEATEWWGRILERSPEYERYARATVRTIPILRLVPAVHTPD
jgi:deazaflavin-dependent oxidoreductase (nitroreductase family)